MHLVFVIPLAIVLISVYVFKNSADEMAYLAATISVVGLFLSLALAPWQIKILLLGIVMLTSKGLWLPAFGRRSIEYRPTKAIDRTEGWKPGTVLASQVVSPSQNTENQTDKSSSGFHLPSIKFINRGDDRDESTSVPVKLTGGEITKKYRGQVLKSPQVDNPKATQPTFTRKYRGVSVDDRKSLTPLIEKTDA